MASKFGPRPVLPEFSKAMNPNYCTIGKIVKPHGNRGEVKVVLMTDFPERFAERREVYLEPPYEPTRMTVQSARPHKKAFLLKFEGIDTIEGAEALVQKFVRIKEEELEPLEEGAYYWHQLEGLTVVDEEDGDIGEVDSIFRAGDAGNEVLVVRGDSGERLVPMIDDVVLGVDLESGTIRVRLPEGM